MDIHKFFISSRDMVWTTTYSCKHISFSLVVAAWCEQQHTLCIYSYLYGVKRLFLINTREEKCDQDSSLPLYHYVEKKRSNLWRKKHCTCSSASLDNYFQTTVESKYTNLLIRTAINFVCNHSKTRITKWSVKRRFRKTI